MRGAPGTQKQRKSRLHTLKVPPAFHNSFVDQYLRSEFAVWKNNEMGITEQRILHSPEGAETTNSRKA
jgi:hypothetical protein